MSWPIPLSQILTPPEEWFIDLSDIPIEKVGAWLKEHKPRWNPVHPDLWAPTDWLEHA